METFRERGEQLLKHAEALRLLRKYGYYDKVGNPRKDAEGKRIWARVQAELRGPIRRV